MPSNEERRKVAARLRKKYVERQGTFEPQSMSIQAMNRLDDLLDCLPIRRGMFLDLADLIEPSERTCHLIRKEWGDPLTGLYITYECDECGCVVKKVKKFVEHALPNYCLNCGAKVVD